MALMADVTVAEEEYLQTLFWLQEAGLPMTGANVARAMQLSPPTVHEMIGRLERDGYITRAGDKSISFTESGQGHAEGIVRRHRLIERFLTDVLGIPWDEVHEEAERLEHAMSPVLEERMLSRARCPATTTATSSSAPASRRSRSTGRSPRRSLSSRTRRPSRASRCPSSS
jgi:Mn-dependent DtxR family transcriptional regulator